MKKHQLMAKIREVIDALDEIISRKGKRANANRELRRCKTALKQLHDELEMSMQHVDPANIIVTVYRVVERIANWLR